MPNWFDTLEKCEKHKSPSNEEETRNSVHQKWKSYPSQWSADTSTSLKGYSPRTKSWLFKFYVGDLTKDRIATKRMENVYCKHSILIKIFNILFSPEDWTDSIRNEMMIHRAAVTTIVSTQEVKTNAN